MATNHGWLLDVFATNAEAIPEEELILRTILNPLGQPLNCRVLPTSHYVRESASPTPMNRDEEIFGIAGSYIREHGDDAVIEVAVRADAPLDAGDLDGQRVWLRVIEAIKEMSSAEKPADAKIH